MTTDETILSKIRKLFRLAGNNSSEAEAASALAKAQALMMEHNISHLGDDPKHVAPGMEPIRGNPMQFDLKWHRWLAQAVSLLYNVRHTTNGLDQIAFWGRRDNVEAAQESMVFIAQQIEHLYKIALNDGRPPEGWTKAQRADLRASFKGAAALRVKQRADEIVSSLHTRIPGHKSLVVINTTKEEIDALFAFAGVKKNRRAAKYKLGLGTGAGIAAGNAVRLQKDLSQ